jgi:nitroreductase
MNDIIKALKSRRSIRTFREKQIPDAELSAVLETGTYAPSGMNVQGWHFTAVKNRALLDELDSTIKQAVKESIDERIKALGEKRQGNLFYNAPTVILVSYVTDMPFPTHAFDSSAAMQNMMIAAHSLGIGSCWIHAPALVATNPKMKSFFSKAGIPETHTVFCSIALGYNNGNEPQAQPRKAGLINIVE